MKMLVTEDMRKGDMAEIDFVNASVSLYKHPVGFPLYKKGAKFYCIKCDVLLFVINCDVYKGETMDSSCLVKGQGQKWKLGTRLICQNCAYHLCSVNDWRVES